MQSIQVYMLGRFELFVDGVDIALHLGKSKKRLSLLAYLLLNPDKPVSCYTLAEMLWPNEASSNPESALKTLISRLRASLVELNPQLEKCILTGQGHYRWNPEMHTYLDVIEFQTLCDEMLSTRMLSPEMRTKFDRMARLYVGDLLPQCESLDWVAPRSVYYHNLYLKTVRHYLHYLKQAGDFSEIIQVCRLALDVDKFDPSLNLELMAALVQEGRNSEAMEQYNYANDAPSAQLSAQPAETVLDFYKQLIHIDEDACVTLDAIRRELLGYKGEEGAFVCEYAIFKDIYNLYTRNLERTGNSMFISLITVTPLKDVEAQPLLLDKVMKMLLDVLRTTLRKGDTITRYSPNQYVVLLTLSSSEAAQVAMERVKKAFYSQYANPNIMVSYRVVPVVGETT